MFHTLSCFILSWSPDVDPFHQTLTRAASLSSVISSRNSINQSEDLTELLEQRSSIAVLQCQSLSLQRQSQAWTGPFRLGRVVSASLAPASCPWSSGLTLGHRSQLQQRATDPGPEEGGSDSEQRGWVRRHVCWIGTWRPQCPEWFMLAYLLLVYTGMVNVDLIMWVNKWSSTVMWHKISLYLVNKVWVYC